MTTPTADARADTAAPADALVDGVRSLIRIARFLEHASDEVSLAHYRVLAAIAAGSERASRIAERLTLGKPTVSAAVDALEQRGLLRRRTLANDQRVAALELTAEGAALLERVEAAMAARLHDLCSRTVRCAALEPEIAALGEALDVVLSERTRTGRA